MAAVFDLASTIVTSIVINKGKNDEEISDGLAAAYFTVLSLAVIAGAIQGAAKAETAGCLGCLLYELIGAIVGFIAMADASNNCDTKYEETSCLVPEGQTPSMFAASLALEVIATLVNTAMLFM